MTKEQVPRQVRDARNRSSFAHPQTSAHWRHSFVGGQRSARGKRRSRRRRGCHRLRVGQNGRIIGWIRAPLGAPAFVNWLETIKQSERVLLEPFRWRHLAPSLDGRCISQDLGCQLSVFESPSALR